MKQTSLPNFLNNTEYIINNVLDGNEPVVIKLQEGNVILMTEEEYNILVLNSNMANIKEQESVSPLALYLHIVQNHFSFLILHQHHQLILLFLHLL